MTTTTFIGDIKFKDGDTERLASELATVEEVNTALKDYVKKTECDMIVGKPATSSTTSYVSIPFNVTEINTSLGTYTLYDDITEADTLRICGYSVNPSKTFTYESVMTFNSSSNAYSHESGTINENTDFAVFIQPNNPVTLVVHRSVTVITSIEKKISERVNTTYNELSYDTYSSNVVVFDGLPGDRIKIDFIVTSNQHKFSYESVISSLPVTMYAGIFIDSSIGYGQIGVLEDPSSPGKIGCRYDNYLTLLSISKVETVTDNNIYAADLGFGESTTYSSIPLLNMRYDSNGVYYDADVNFGESVVVEGFYETPTNTFSYEGVLTSQKIGDRTIAPIEFTMQSNQQFNIIFESAPTFTQMTLWHQDKHVVVTSLKRKSSNDEIMLTSANITTYSKKSYQTIPYYLDTVNGNLMTIFNGSFGDQVKLSFIMKDTQYEFSCEVVLKKNEDNVHLLNAGIKISSGVVYGNIGQIGEHTESGKLMLKYNMNDFQLLSISKLTTDNILTYNTLNQPSYENALSEFQNNQFLLNAKQGDTIHLKGNGPNSSFTFDCSVKIPATNSLKVMTSDGVKDISVQHDVNGKLLLITDDIWTFDAIETVQPSIFDRLKLIESRIAAVGI